MPEKQIIATVPDASCGFGMLPDVLVDSRTPLAERPRAFHVLATIVHGYKNVEGKRVSVHFSPDTFERLIKSFVEMSARSGRENAAWTQNDYLSAKAGAARLREMAEALDAEAEAMPAWRKPAAARDLPRREDGSVVHDLVADDEEEAVTPRDLDPDAVVRLREYVLGLPRPAYSDVAADFDHLLAWAEQKEADRG